MSWRFRDIFDEFDRTFRETEEMFERIFKNLRTIEPKGDEPIVYGFTATIGPDGVPHVRTFGNVDPMRGQLIEEGIRKPYTDVVYDKDAGVIRVTAELPGVEKENIKLKATENSLSISAEGEKRKFKNTIPFDVEIDPKSIKATFKNGILEVTIKTKKPLKPEEYDIKIE